jgi:class 3 adenylate cyclase
MGSDFPIAHGTLVVRVPHFIDIHDVTGATPEAIAEAHSADVACQEKYGVNYVKYWFNESRAKVFCLCTAPDAETANRVHKEAHGLVAERIIEVDPDLADSFLGGGPVSSTGAVVLPHNHECDPGIRTIVFTDIVGSTAMTQRLGDQAAMRMLDVHDRIVRAAIGGHLGREVKHLGDGIMAAFISAANAVQCAAAIQAALRDAAPGSENPVQVRIGVASGEPVERQGDFFGTTVQLAARLCAYAQPGQTVASTPVTLLCKTARFDDLGEVLLKGFERPTRAHLLVG